MKLSNRIKNVIKYIWKLKRITKYFIIVIKKKHIIIFCYYITLQINK